MMTFKRQFLFTVAFLIACVTQAQNVPPAATVLSKIIVPAGLNTTPFNVDRYLKIPENFSISVYARVGGARFMAIAPNGDLLVSASNGAVKIIRAGAVTNYVSGLTEPHDIVFHKIGDIMYVYIAENFQVRRYVYKNGDLAGINPEIVVTGLPAIHHTKKNIALDANHKLYVSIGSSCNACPEDATSNPKKGAIYQYDANGKNGRLFAQGLRNAEGLDFLPGTNDLWVVVNNRDDIIYPYTDNMNLYGTRVQSFVDDNPVEEFTKVKDGGNYGWPFCNPDSRTRIDTMPYNNDYELNKDGSKLNCANIDKVSKGIQAHSAPLGFNFTQNTAIAEPYRNGALVALHGSWDRSKKTGYKVIYFPWKTIQQFPGDQITLIDGFLGTDSSTVFARPVDVAIDQQGNLFVSDDYAGTIFKMSYNAITATSEGSLNGSIEVYPIPAEKNVNVSIVVPNATTANLQLTNEKGVEVYSTNKMLHSGKNFISIETGQIPNALYFLKIRTDLGEVTRKIVVSHH